MPEEEAEDHSCLEALQVAADEGMRACRSAKCNRWQCQALATLLGNLVAYSRHWNLFFPEQFRRISGVRNVVRELVKPVEAAKRLICEYGEKDWLSKALVSQENSLGFQSIVEEIEKYVEMISSHLGDASSNRILDLRSKIDLDTILLHDFLQEAEKKDRVDMDLKVEEQLRNASAIFSRPTRVRCNKLATKLQRRNTQSTFDIEANELVVSKELLGKGNGGRVYKATWLGLPVAVKVAAREDIHFNRETDIMRGLQPSHPNVVQILGTSESGEDKRLVMELMDRNLREFLISERLPLREKVDILLQIANGMFFLHQNDVCYRDLKPQNVLVRAGPRLQIKLADFGHSRDQFLSFDPSLTVPVGTPHYMAPECLRRGGYTKKADVFSFSITCAEVLTGEFSSVARMEERLNRLVKGERPRLPRECPQRLMDLIRRCWDLEPEKRPGFEEINQVLWEIKEELLIGPVLFSRRASLATVSTSLPRALSGVPLPRATTISRLERVASDLAPNFSRNEDPEGWSSSPTSTRLQRQFGSGSVSVSSTESGPSTPRTSPGIFDLRITGDCKVGAKLTASWKFGGGTRSCLVQWGRYLQVDAEEAEFPNDPMPTKATESEFLITPDYLGSRICVKVLPVAGDLQTGEQAQSVCSNAVSLDTKSQQKLDSHLLDGHVSFDVKIEGQVLAGRLEMSSNEYHLWWSMSNRKNFREKYSAGVSLEASQEEGTICFLKSSIKNRTYRLRFNDMQKRNLAVVTMRRFMVGNFS